MRVAARSPYVAPPLAYGYIGRGLGEVGILASFGLLPTLGSYYAQTGKLGWAPILAALPPGLFNLSRPTSTTTATAGSTERYSGRREAIASERKLAWVHPYDDPYVMSGQGTVGLEMLEDAPGADVVLVQVGGGGLVSGIATAVKGLRPGARVIAIEPERSPALHESLKAGEPVTVEAKSIADGLNGPYAGANCVRVCTDLGVESVLVSEDALEHAFRFLYGRVKVACEVAGAATTAALLEGKVDLEPGQKVAAVVSGGNVAPKTAAAILAADEA